MKKLSKEEIYDLLESCRTLGSIDPWKASKLLHESIYECCETKEKLLNDKK